MTKLLPWVLVALALVAAVIVYMLLTGGKQHASVTLGGLRLGGGGGDIDFGAIDDIFRGFV